MHVVSCPISLSLRSTFYNPIVWVMPERRAFRKSQPIGKARMPETPASTKSPKRQNCPNDSNARKARLSRNTSLNEEPARQKCGRSKCASKAGGGRLDRPCNWSLLRSWAVGLSDCLCSHGPPGRNSRGHASRETPAMPTGPTKTRFSRKAGDGNSSQQEERASRHHHVAANPILSTTCFHRPRSPYHSVPRGLLVAEVTCKTE